MSESGYSLFFVLAKDRLYNDLVTEMVVKEAQHYQED